MFLCPAALLGALGWPLDLSPSPRPSTWSSPLGQAPGSAAEPKPNAAVPLGPGRGLRELEGRLCLGHGALLRSTWILREPSALCQPSLSYFLGRESRKGAGHPGIGWAWRLLALSRARPEPSLSLGCPPPPPFRAPERSGLPKPSRRREGRTIPGGAGMPSRWELAGGRGGGDSAPLSQRGLPAPSSC